MIECWRYSPFFWLASQKNRVRWLDGSYKLGFWAKKFPLLIKFRWIKNNHKIIATLRYKPLYKINHSKNWGEKDTSCGLYCRMYCNLNPNLKLDSTINPIVGVALIKAIQTNHAFFAFLWFLQCGLGWMYIIFCQKYQFALVPFNTLG